MSHITAQNVHETLRKHMLVDGFDLVFDTQKSQGSRLVDAKSGRTYLDFFSFFASSPVGANHPRMLTGEFREGLIQAATNNPSNSDVYTTIMADFVDTYSRVGIPKYLPHLFLVSGGALAVENALKTAFDWKVRKSHPKGFTSEAAEEKYVNGMKIIYFQEAFHGRSGYTMTMTNTFYRHKIQYFPKFNWIKAPNPKINFPLDAASTADVKARESASLDFIRNHIRQFESEIAALIIEPVQAEGGDNHFRPEFHQALRQLCHEHDILLIHDEVQTGVGLTGSFWAHQRIGVQPDIMAFGKKMQVCGILAGPRIDEVKDHVFQKAGRINSTWGGNLADMYRSTWYLRIIEEEELVANAHVQGEYLQSQLRAMQSESDLISGTRGMGLMCAFDLPTYEMRDRMIEKAKDHGLLILKCGERAIRLRPALNVTRAEIDEAVDLMRKSLMNI